MKPNQEEVATKTKKKEYRERLEDNKGMWEDYLLRRENMKRKRFRHYHLSLAGLSDGSHGKQCVRMAYENAAFKRNKKYE